MPTKIEDVAQRAGVSTATVSRVLSGKPYVSEELRIRVVNAAQELDYRPSRIARSLREQRSRIIGLKSPITLVMATLSSACMRMVRGGRSEATSGMAILLMRQRAGIGASPG